jgi:hypothetical protein
MGKPSKKKLEGLAFEDGQTTPKSHGGGSAWPKWGWPATPMVAKGGGSTNPLLFYFIFFNLFIYFKKCIILLFLF